VRIIAKYYFFSLTLKERYFILTEEDMRESSKTAASMDKVMERIINVFNLEY